MKQSRLTSFIKSCVSTGVGFGVAFVANMLILPWFGLDISHSANLLLTTIYTAISIARGYLLERFYEALGWRTRMSAFASAVLAECQRQRDVEGWDAAHDDAHARGELAQAGAAYLIGPEPLELVDHTTTYHRVVVVTGRLLWPWGVDWYKPKDDYRRRIVQGCALGIAEGEKFDRARKSHRMDERTAMTAQTNSQKPSLVNQT